MQTTQAMGADKRVLSLYQLLDPEVIANPYPFIPNSVAKTRYTGIRFCMPG